MNVDKYFIKLGYICVYLRSSVDNLFLIICVHSRGAV